MILFGYRFVRQQCTELRTLSPSKIEHNIQIIIVMINKNDLSYNEHKSTVRRDTCVHIIIFK